jgi:signal-transduction protein with cAMP-binding, CBS, and nucleotidyltransferase domain
VNSGETVKDAAGAMREAHVTEAVVMGSAGVTGIVTERDIIYKVVAAGLDPHTVKVREIMSSPVEVIENTAHAGDAIAKMSRLGIRRLGVCKNGKFMGLVTQMNLASGKLTTTAPLPELAKPGGLVCPYCGASAKDVRDLSKHIDHAHLGLGLLEGDVSKW